MITKKDYLNQYNAVEKKEKKKREILWEQARITYRLDVLINWDSGWNTWTQAKLRSMLANVKSSTNAKIKSYTQAIALDCEIELLA